MAGKWKEKFTSPGDHLPIHSFMTAYAIRSISTCCFGDIDHRDLVEFSDEYVVVSPYFPRKSKSLIS